MRDEHNISAFAAVLIGIGILVLLVGLAMSATTTQTSETCYSDPSGYGQECISGSVTMPNPLRGPTIGVGILSILGGIGVYFVGKGETALQESNEGTEEKVKGGLSEKIQEQQDSDK